MASLTIAAPAPHDLVWLDDPASALARVALPAWVSLPALHDTPVVVRRDGRRPGEVPVGLRGRTRAERFGTWIAPSAIRKLVTPMDLAAVRAWRLRPDLTALPAIRALEAIAGRLDAAGMRWGVTGSAGFSLACAANVLHADSDLDLVVQADQPLPGSQIRLLDQLQRTAPVRVDIQIATPFGGFALLERLRSGARVLLKTEHGPCLCDDPWHPSPCKS
ncbi:malonate decarboxylase holo-ACP synthase [Cupriavidus neocaledonicus]|uniref:Phosphoribosyl-dephospho-CoA transferase n=1 Tax=Cupriavidus neocaledonicus TaxID=1040979 RepID=A0A375H311_9BURK|nr:malonate decarboxylase holo-ACP synthase [Cupriavidus neocaledonicus]SOZ37737.1 Phosphoribosyl-dephospho-CoA transferase [Cupriavidus neocaledonicus]SPD46311.1 Phosphoribosyl-dephospho-CoA transferase [Cupriavidus neocaledonicus]